MHKVITTTRPATHLVFDGLFCQCRQLSLQLESDLHDINWNWIGAAYGTNSRHTPDPMIMSAVSGCIALVEHA